MASDPVYVPLSEEFSSLGWSRYTTITPFTTSSGMGRVGTPSYPGSLATLNHIDLRTFNSQSPKSPIDHDEHWTGDVGAVSWGPNSNFNNLRMLAWNAGTTPITLTSISDVVDLTQIGSTSSVLLQATLVNLAVINEAESYLALSSNGGTTWSQVPLSIAITNGQLSFPLDEFTNDLTIVNGVQIHLVPASTGTFGWIGLRAVDPNYVEASVAFDTWNGTLRQDIPPTISGTTYTYSTLPASQQIPVTYYTSSSGASDDPQPIDATFSVVFNTGGNTGSNQFMINMRQVGGTDVSQQLLQDQTQLQLTGPQPNLTATEEVPRKISDFQGKSLGYMQGVSMLDLDATSAQVTDSFLSFSVSWGTNQTISIGNSSEGNYVNYDWNYDWSFLQLENYAYYMATCQLEENSVRIQLYSLNQETLAPVVSIYDTGVITDSYQFPRRPGRIGWQANFSDGEAHLLSIRPESTLFAEYQSVPLNSRTPVQGAQVYATYSSNLQLWDSFSPADMSPFGQAVSPIVTADTKRSLTGSSTKVYINKASANQGIISNVLSQDGYSGITDWDEVEINFSVWVPSVAQVEGSSTLGTYLVNEHGWYIPLSFPAIKFDTWQNISFEGPDIPSGPYRLQIIYLGSTPTTFWVDAVNVSQRLIGWSARANPNDPWVAFNDLTGNVNSGVYLNRGKQLQVRAQAKRQDAGIFSKPKIKPVFAELGKAQWPEDTPTLAPVNSTSSFTFTNVGRSYTFNSTVTPLNSADVAQWIWQTSDGDTVIGSTLEHTFSPLAASNTTYQVTLTVIDIYGNRSTTVETISVP
jgi:hypothetical protein